MSAAREEGLSGAVVWLAPSEWDRLRAITAEGRARLEATLHPLQRAAGLTGEGLVFGVLLRSLLEMIEAGDAEVLSTPPGPTKEPTR